MDRTERPFERLTASGAASAHPFVDPSPGADYNGPKVQEGRSNRQDAAGRLSEVANEQGKRYVCSKCGSEVLVTRGGEGTIKCCGQPVKPKS